MGRYFGTDGFRGEANKNLTVEHAYKVGRFIGWYYHQMTGKKCKVVIGKDTRRSSYMFEYSLVAGLTASGADAYLLHVTTTPSVSYVTRTEDFDCGIMISASHNPFYDNGIKLINSRGEKMDDETIADIETYLDGNLAALGIEGDVPSAKREELGEIVDYVSGRNRYVGYLISLAAHSYKNMRVGLDCANGSSWMLAKNVFNALGAKTYVMGDEPDGFNINNGVGSTHIEALRRFVLANELDVGFAYDGDADRCLAVDEQGGIITGDHILYVCGRHLKQQGELPRRAEHVRQVDHVVLEQPLNAVAHAVNMLYAVLAAGAENARKTGIDDTGGAAALADNRVDAHACNRSLSIFFRVMARPSRRQAILSIIPSG